MYECLDIRLVSGFRLQQDKLRIGKSSVKAFGHIISEKGIEPDPDSVQPILTIPVPSSVKEVQSFLGMVNYFQDFMEDLSAISEPLRALTRKDAEFKWNKDQDLAFQTIEGMLASRTKLNLFDPDAETMVTTDASDVGIGALLSQRVNREERPIAFYCKTLDSTERNYAANEREALACVRALEHWENLLLGRKFRLRTDHQALENVAGGR